MSATVCTPVMSSRSSLGPRLMLMLQHRSAGGVSTTEERLSASGQQQVVAMCNPSGSSCWLGVAGAWPWLLLGRRPGFAAAQDRRLLLQSSRLSDMK